MNVLNRKIYQIFIALEIFFNQFFLILLINVATNWVFVLESGVKIMQLHKKNPHNFSIKKSVNSANFSHSQHPLLNTKYSTKYFKAVIKNSKPGHFLETEE